MKRCILIFLCMISHYLFAQSVQGVIVDEADQKPLENASIVLLDTDSIMRYFTRADPNGKFSLEKIEKGEYLFLVTYPKFEILSQPLEIKNDHIDLKSISLNSQSNLLEEVVINQKIPIKIKGDTIEYDAGSFETEKNAKLEDLLRRLPGLTVSASGEITAQGKNVSKVLIDGEEFFGYDPKIAIRNVRADAVDKVQVYERKSDEAELTGIDDGERYQTVNVVLKEEARQGIFGNANASLGTESLFDANIFAAKFNRSERLAFTGNWNNMTNGGDASRIRMNNQIVGRPTHKSGGLNYENNFLDRKLHLTSSYNFLNNGMANESSSYNMRILNDNHTQETTRESDSESDSKQHTLRSRIRYRIDSVSNLNIQLNGGKGQQTSANNSKSTTIRNGTVIANEFESRNSSKSDKEDLDMKVDYRRRLHKNGRSLNLHLNTRIDNTTSTNQVNEQTNLYDSLGVFERDVSVHQTRLVENTNNGMGVSFNLSEPITRQLNATLGYSFNTNSRTGLTNAYDIDSHTTDMTLDSLYSKNEKNHSRNNGVDLSLNFNTEKFNINVTNRMTHRYQELADSYRDVELSRSFWQNNLNANVSYRISNNKNLTIRYQNNTNVPSFTQLQPIQPPTNELYRQLGNPDLKRETNNNINFNFNKFSLLKASSFNINAMSGFTKNAIVNRSIIDEEGRTTTSFVNIQDHINWNGRVHANYTRPILNGIVQFGPFTSLQYANNYEYVNGELNRSNNTNANAGISANKEDSKNVNFNLNLSIGVNNEVNSLREDLNNTAFRSAANADLKYFLPFKFSLTQVLHYGYTGKSKVFPEPITQFYMNLELTRKLLQDESLLLSVKAFDVFNSFNNTNRSFNDNSFSESQQLMLTQYFMLGLKWDFNKNLGKKSES
ncbi:hypothetical protein C5749_18020 [Sphingobacterium gobiense]|uniref:Outer membrane protein beta-barrel domain-containing protein n=2 Tax=Sphingobacterium gobiense TaxID=1382456 RepID=A0A2S9JEK0_9SPHI|nr:hypothetical protein C5749_18020 [Sphingobacterium gobiense]